MSLSPFRARLAFAAFLVISSAVAANLFAMQTPKGQLPQGHALAERSRLAMDTARLDRMARQVAEVSEPAPARQAEKADKRSKAASGTGSSDVKGQMQRVGSFAPSSGQLALSAMPGGDPVEARKATVRAIQLELARRGYEPGPASGTPGLVTRAAVLAYEHDQGLPLTADPSPEVLAHLRHGTSAPGAAIGLDASATLATGHAETVIKSVQQALGSLGYHAVTPDGVVTEETVRAIREFEMDSGLVPTGRISGPLTARLVRAQSRGKAEGQ